MPGVCELPKLEGTPQPQYLAGGRFSGLSLLFNAHRKQNRPTPDVQVAKITTRACKETPPRVGLMNSGLPGSGMPAGLLSITRLKPVHFDLAKGEVSRRGTEVKLFSKLE